jgi:predicted flavoprotein YhiN
MAKWVGEDVTMSLSCFPHLTIEEVGNWFSSASRLPGRKTVLSFLSQQLPVRLAEALCSLVDQHDQHASSTNSDYGITRKLAMTPLNQLSQGRRKSLVRVLMDLSLPVINHRGWNFAEVTAGGVPLSEINPKTMMSRKVPGLYLIGEMLDCDGRIGGFNFQWAWSTGFIAGRSVAGDLTKSLEEGSRCLVDENRQTESHS